MRSRVRSVCVLLTLAAAGACAADASQSEDVDAGRADAAPLDDAGVDVETANDAGDRPPQSDAACASTGAELPNDLRCTGLYADWATKTVAADARAYAPAFPFWADGAVKSRWVNLPPGKTIDVTDPNEWTFPIGTKFWKEFVLGGKRIETRLFQKTSTDEWARTTYQWSADESAATRLDTGFGGPAPSLGLIDDGGGELDGAAHYEIPNLLSCDGCHKGRRDKILGFDAINLGASSASGVTLAVLESEGRLSLADGGPAALPPTLTIPEDATGKGARVAGWLHGNCGVVCHNANPSSACLIDMHLRIGVEELVLPDGGAPTLESLEVYRTIYDVAPTTNLGDPAQKPYRRIMPGAPQQSLLRYLTGRRTSNEIYGQMPPIDSHIVDVANVANLEAWITALQ